MWKLIPSQITTKIITVLPFQKFTIYPIEFTEQFTADR